MKKIAAHLKAKLSARLSRTPLWVSFMLMTSLLLLASTLLLSLFNYNYSRSGSIREYNTQSERLLNLKAQNLKSYLDNLSEFCVLPVTDNTFYQQLHQTVPLSEAAQQDILQKVQTYYYTRTDLNAYHLYMLNQNLVVGRSSGDQRIKMQSAPDMDGNQQLEMCLKAKSGTAISPSGGCRHRGYTVRPAFRYGGDEHHAVQRRNPSLYFREGRSRIGAEKPERA